MRAAMYLKKHKVTRKQAMTMEMMKVPLADAAPPPSTSSPKRGTIARFLTEARDYRQFCT